MKQTTKAKYVTFITAAFFLIGFLLCVFHKPVKVSKSERRYLAMFPKFTVEGILSGKDINAFEDYTLDQFPYRDTVRTIKALTQFQVFGQKDNNKIYVKDGKIYKIIYPLSESSIVGAANKFNNLYEKYFKDTEVSLYYSVIPDKSYFVASKTGYPSLNDERLVSLLQQTLHSDFQYINLYDCLTEDDYYKTDTHWKQQNLSKVVDRISSEMGFESYITNSYTETTYEPFYGVYYGQSSLPMKPDTLTYLRNDIIDQCEVYNFETNQTTGVYNTDKLNGMDAYDIYLSGATPLITITNPLAKRDKELVVFRDSFGSSLAPLFAEGYSKITLVDLRYMSSNYLEQYLTFTNQDILFLYSTLVLNNSTMLK